MIPPQISELDAWEAGIGRRMDRDRDSSDMMDAGETDGVYAKPLEFHHEALIYSGDEEFLAGTVPLIRETVAEDGVVLAAVGDEKIRLLRGELNGESEGVRFVDMAALGRNPARIIPVWRDFVDANVGPGGSFCGIGEPVGPGRTGAELDECLRHEALLNLAFDGGPGWRLVCPYDSDGLDDEVLADAHRSHPLVDDHGDGGPSDRYEPSLAGRALDGDLPSPPAGADGISFRASTLGSVRRFAFDHAGLAGLDRDRAEDFEFSLNELASNSVRHGGGGGTARIWLEEGSLVCEVRDAGVFTDPLAGRARPGAMEYTGRGLWMVNQFCDLVQIRSGPDGSTVRARMKL
jgi:anti-sigma regulatory factor (Ser/Thr protein kinase)